MAVVFAPRPKLGFWDYLYFPAIVQGLRITLKNLFRKKVTLNFPEQKFTFPKKYRGYPKLIMGDNGIENCVACKLCEIVCPPSAITIHIAEHDNVDQRERVPAKFDIDMGRCIVCGMCEEACPEQAIMMSDIHIMSSSTRKDLIFDKDLLLSDYQTLQTMRGDKGK